MLPDRFQAFVHDKFIGFTIPKCGCSSLRSWFYSLAFNTSYEDVKQTGTDIHDWFLFSGHPSIQFLSSGEIDGKPSFVVVRNPMDRAVSAYIDKIGNRNNHMYYRPGVSFEMWIQHLYSIRGISHEWDSHFRPQWMQFPDNVGHVIKIGSLSSGMDSFCKIAGINPPKWKNPKKRSKDIDVGDAERRKIYEIYKKDFNLLS